MKKKKKKEEEEKEEGDKEEEKKEEGDKEDEDKDEDNDVYEDEKKINIKIDKNNNSQLYTIINTKGLNPLDKEKFNYLLNSKDINFFKIGPKLISLIHDYMKDYLLEEKLDYYFIFEDFNDFKNLLSQKKIISSECNAADIKNTKIVAMTTTFCSKNPILLEKCNFETIIIEEAAEILEPHIISLLTQKTKKLILIGDHKQLRPKPYDFELSKKYNFEISMFERLINNNIPYVSLKYQRRMKPLFADFVRLIYGETEYEDYKDIKNKEKVKGIFNDMFIIEHDEPESDNNFTLSKENNYEARFLARLSHYLIIQGYKKNQITILTFYRAQVLLIKKYLELYKITKIKVTTVDDYQGYECDIILLSLVRSNKNYEIGFLKIFNRVCVAFSRAKIGFYIIGNINCIIKGESLLEEDFKNNKNIKIKEEENEFNPKIFGVWKKIKEKALELKIIGKELFLECQTHKNITIIKSDKDFENIKDGGCNKICNQKMKCGHLCNKYCHISKCKENNCREMCLIKLPCGHICQGKCQKCLGGTLHVKCFEK